MINIVNYEMTFNNGILSKYANKMKEHLDLLGVESFISPTPQRADICHHINYLPYRPNEFKNTLMITHIFEGYKLDKVKEAMKTADVGICFSKETKDFLIEKGVEGKLEVILPAHDGLKKKKKIAVVTNVYPDGCKREKMFYDLLGVVDKDKFEFIVMGSGWNLNGIEYYPKFDLKIYENILNACDYLLYFGKDEGAMSVLDAKHLGLRIIAPLTGFHHEVGIDYPFDAQNDLNGIFESLAASPVEDWTWENYTLQHLNLWKKLL